MLIERIRTLHPRRYAELLGERIARHGSNVWLINTGWSGGPYGTFPSATTRLDECTVSGGRAIASTCSGGRL